MFNQNSFLLLFQFSLLIFFSDIVLDNVGYEFFTDLCLADYIVSTNLSKIVRIYVKSIPWFISDVMTHDFEWTLDQLAQGYGSHLQKLGER